LKREAVKTLSICIPTYRRPALLERCVRSVISSAADRPIEIVVADDSVSDINAGTLTRLIEEFPFVRWYRNERNLGIDANIQRAVELSDADYAWLIGEDDIFLPGAIARMHARIQSCEDAFLFANYRYVATDPMVVLRAAVVDEPMPPSMSRNEFLSKYLWAIGFIGACVVRKSDWRFTDPTPYQGTYFTHVGRIAEMLAGHATVAIEAETCVANRVEGAETFTWKHDSYGVFAGFLAMCERVGTRVPEMRDLMAGAASAFERRFGCLSLRLAARLRSERALDRNQFDKYLRHNARLNTVTRWLLLLISMTPPQLLSPLVMFYRRVLR
jgi:glycosyltransferase involved in cell wall biosynthesis